MNKQSILFSAALLAIVSGFTHSALAADSAVPAPTAAAPATAQAITKEQAIAMATKAHPGEVTKTYADTKKGKKTWEVKINGADGKKWEIHYEISSGALVSEEGK